MSVRPRRPKNGPAVLFHLFLFRERFLHLFKLEAVGEASPCMLILRFLPEGTMDGSPNELSLFAVAVISDQKVEAGFLVPSA